MDEDWESEIDTKPSIVPVYSNLVSEQENGESSNRFNRNEDGPRNHGFARRGGYSGNECDQNNGFSRRGGYNANEDRQRDGFSKRGGYSAGEDGQRSNRGFNSNEDRQRDGFSRRGGYSAGDDGQRSNDFSRRGFNADNSGQKRNDSSRRGGYNEDGQQSSNYSRRGGYSADEDGQRSNNFSRRGGFSQSNSDFDAHSRGRGGGTGGRGFSSAGGYRGKNEEIGVEPVKGQEENDEQGPKVTYIPPPPPETEDAIFAHYQTGINFDKYDEILVQVSGDDVPPALMSFEEANLSDTLNKNISRAGYLKLTPVQKYSIPIILAGRDLMACAQTGSGKTAAFLLPILAHMMKEGITASHFKELQEPEAIIIAPTRELINQIYLEARKFSYGTCIRPVVIYGGTQTGHSIRQILQGCNMLCATPGRLMDIINKGKIGLSNIKYLVFDEADRMLDMGFKPDIEKLTSYKEMPSKENRQTLMFSATYPEAIQRLAGQFLKPDYLFLTVGQVGGACSDVEQTILEVGQFEKKDKLLEILQTIGNERTLVFVKTKKKADYIALILCQEQLPSTSIHGDRPQQERETALWKFRSGECPILVATSVAARGLDIENVQHVINLDLPKEIDEYVHRIGRTGRCGNIGKAISFFDRKDDEDIGIARSLVKVLSDAQQEVPVWLEEIAFSAHGTSSYNPRGNVFASVDSRKVGVVKEKESVGSVGFHQDANEDTWE